ncbi:2447_t:CDS:2 [Scutellospora calospora]|uniref:2447_t:CDS:1 n=1 Tax=Scutellospora calospora TaxID=85575 RepID=A0ACA9JUG3_9GLOM|nr:2447_t:CDS:2 [Scutellospora calospora]
MHISLFRWSFLLTKSFKADIYYYNDPACNQFITEPSVKNGSYYYGYFSIPFENGYKLILPLSNDTKKYGNRGGLQIGFQFNILDKNTSSSISVQVSDSGNISSIFLQSVAQANTYQIRVGESSYLYLGRNLRQFIIQNWKSIFGFQPDYDIKPYLTSRKYIERMHFNSLTFIIAKADYDITTVETEQRTHTVLNSLGLLGGAWSLAIVVYKLLYGDDVVRPFGLVHKHGHFHKQTKEKLAKFLSTYPLVQHPESSIDINDNPVERLERKINDFELFLRDYVVEAQQLDKANRSIESTKDK